MKIVWFVSPIAFRLSGPPYAEFARDPSRFMDCPWRRPAWRLHDGRPRFPYAQGALGSAVHPRGLARADRIGPRHAGWGAAFSDGRAHRT
ncbi:protein of unknown function [Thiomonas sp. Bio17B3]|nr:protein of unknown function [Thiomonas sp. Bio17B3]VDY12966.1 protein of unknown function [Thiomonas sp. OC7]